MIKRTCALWSLALAFAVPCHAQDFIPGINLYNRAQYDSLIYVFAPQFIPAHPQEEGLARFFLGECYYNKALTERDRSKSRAFFAAAWNEFQRSRSRADLPEQFKEFYFSITYKMGWCSYRLAELNERPRDLLKRAAEEFLAIQPEAPDSVRLFSAFMAADCKIRASLFKLYWFADQDSQIAEATDILSSIEDARGLLTGIIDFRPPVSAPKSILELQRAASSKRTSLNYYLGKFYQLIPAEAFSLVRDSRKKTDARRTAIHYFSDLQYDSLLTSSSVPAQRSQLSYLNLMKYFNLHIMGRDDASKNRFMAELDKMRRNDFITEGRFRLAGIYQCTPEDEETNFNKLAIQSYDSSFGIAEAAYWMANIEMIEGDIEMSRLHFQRYINSMPEPEAISPRSRTLLDDAQIKKYLLDFETLYLSGKMSELHELAREVSGFAPASPSLRQRANRLHLLTSLALAAGSPEIWSSVLSGSDDEKLEQALDAIMFILSRAALNIGVTREKYSALLSPLFEITQERRSDATQFLRGIVRTLEAEIQARPDEKIEIYKAAADILRQIRDHYEFKAEADYVRGICLFYAEEFEQAQEIFVPLINLRHSMRALFYMGEIFRLSGRGRAARECYQAIIARLSDSRDNFSEYWFANSLAGIASSDASGGTEALANIDLQQIEFLPTLNASALIFERLADEGFLKQQNTRETLEMLVKYGLPQKEFYPSKHVLRPSLFISENIFKDSPPLIDEVRGALTSTLRLTVVVPVGVEGQTEVVFDGEALNAGDEAFVRGHIPLNSEHHLVVRHPGCYDSRQVHKFSKPGEESKVVVLTKKIKFSKVQMVKQTEKINQFIPTRWDGNRILNRYLPAQSEASELLRDFSGSFELRDAAVDKVGDRILAVQCADNSLWRYSNDIVSKKIDMMKLSLSEPLNSPEGVTADSHGHFYVADWGNHRVLKFNRDGVVTQVIGGFGANHPSDVGKPIKLVFPTRLVVLEDQEGVMVNGEAHFREPYLFLADHNGIHLCNLSGEYLDSLLLPSHALGPGSFYAFAVERNSRAVTLFLAKRTGNDEHKMFEFVAN